MKLVYVSASHVPSNTANCVHVLHQVDALVQEGAVVTLYCSNEAVPPEVRDAELKKVFDLDISCIGWKGPRSQIGFAKVFQVAIWFFINHLRCSHSQMPIYSRNLYASFFLSIVRRRGHIYEAHLVEQGWRQWLLKYILSSQTTEIIAISHALKEDLEKNFPLGSKTVAVLHDAATTKIKPIVARKKQQIRNSIFEKPIPQSFFCGYAGSLHSGRGINVLFELAKEFSFVNFVVIGGNENQIRSWEGGVPDNVIFLGQKPYKKVVELLPSFDCLIMPYQATVSIGNGRDDTGKWMSPLKMFEYMASGVPILSSDLPVLREVLRDRENSLLVPAGQIEKWKLALDTILSEPSLASKLGNNARREFEQRYTWRHRARSIMKCFADAT